MTCYRYENITPRERLLEDAGEAVQDRAGPYGPPTDCFATIALRWTLLLGAPITPLQVALCMIDLKMARLTETPSHRDSLVDIAGYAACAAELLESPEQ